MWLTACQVAPPAAATLAEAAAPGASAPALETGAPSLEASETAPAAVQAQPARSLQEVRKAVIQIRAQGAFQVPQGDAGFFRPGRGSGFLIDPSGIAITSQHAVAGAEALSVTIGEGGESYPAKVLGVSECSGLAVLQLEGEAFPYLEWRTSPPSSSTALYVAGHNLEDGKFSLSKGVFLSDTSPGAAAWGNFAGLIEYDVYADPGSAGGPLVDSDGQVIGIHLAGDRENRRGFGLGQAEARRLAELLKEGSAPAVGVNGYLFPPPSGGSGLWVAAVHPGSPAAAAGLQNGDLLVRLGELDLAAESTLAGFCRLLESAPAGQPLALQIYRSGSATPLVGELYGTPIAEAAPTAAPQEVFSASEIIHPDAEGSGAVLIDAGFADAQNWYSFALPADIQFQALVRNERLFILVDQREASVYSLHKVALPADVKIEAAVETVQGPNRNNISLICRATEKGWYEFSMNSGGYWYIWRYEAGSYIMLNSGGSLDINLQKAANQVAAVCQGETLTFYVNGMLTGQASDDVFTGEGQVGISVSTFEIPGAGVEFDWFKVTIP